MFEARKLTRWLLVGVLAAAMLAAAAVAVWPASAADTAYDDGVRVGQAVDDLRNADTYTDVDNALTDVRHATRDARDHAGDELDQQITDEQSAFFDALNGAAGSVQSTDDWDQSLYEDQLDSAIDDLSSNADEFRTNGPDVVQSFWNGVQDGLDT
jgi:hypothetical protein